MVNYKKLNTVRDVLYCWDVMNRFFLHELFNFYMQQRADILQHLGLSPIVFTKLKGVLIKINNYNAFPWVSMSTLGSHRLLYVKCMRLKRVEKPYWGKPIQVF